MLSAIWRVLGGTSVGCVYFLNLPDDMLMCWEVLLPTVQVTSNPHVSPCLYFTHKIHLKIARKYDLAHLLSIFITYMVTGKM